MIRRKTVDNSIEDKIITGMIVSSKFCRDIQQKVKSEYFQVPYANRISAWCMNYYKQYKKAPEGNIKDIYESEKAKLKSEEAELVADFLTKLSGKYEMETHFNSDYLLDLSLPYFKKRSLQLITEKVSTLLDLNRIEDAEKEMNKYKDIKKETSQWFNPFSDEEAKAYFEDVNKGANVLFKFPGSLGELIGPFERDWLVGILSPTKRGKTWWLQEMAIQGIMDKLKVVFISLEMSKHQVKERLYKRITALGQEPKDYVYPCFDCYKNQIGSCNKVQRENKYKLEDATGKRPLQFDPNLKYRPCTACRGTKEFILESWFTTIHRDKMKYRNTQKVYRGMNQMFGDNLRVIAYPEYSANVSTFMADLETLEESEGFVPDIIIPDYADIFAPEDNRVTGRDRIDETWKALKNIAGTKHCLVVTGSQSNRLSFDKKNVYVTDASEDIRKIAHSNMFLALNQIAKREDIAGVVRVAKIVARSSSFDANKSCTVLQNFELGQTLLDSEIGYINYNLK
jgi:replicative DNA helicase